MDNGTPVFSVGKWLIFKAGTCFGNTKQHKCVILGIDKSTGSIAVAVNATSQVEKRRDFVKKRKLPKNTLIIIKKKSPEGSVHFTEETAIDCNNAKEIYANDMQKWLKNGLVKIVDYNEDVSEVLLKDIKAGVLASPMISKKIKDIVK